ncbi:unnamed protein product [Chrysodeixis includens]|uniref:Uncharacterized protein n=1 Tax=Chrysodeixis includens TaxID=689277 RepID=A0A9N8KRK5_CHRIL|nr:unnamed protein product [Chrysodeixis includens]
MLLVRRYLNKMYYKINKEIKCYLAPHLHMISTKTITKTRQEIYLIYSLRPSVVFVWITNKRAVFFVTSFLMTKHFLFTNDLSVYTLHEENSESYMLDKYLRE